MLASFGQDLCLEEDCNENINSCSNVGLLYEPPNGIQYDSIHDNLQDSLLIKKHDSTNTISILYNYIENKIMINSDRIRLKILNKYLKSIKVSHEFNYY